MWQTVVTAMAAAMVLTVAAELLLPEGNLRQYALPIIGLLVLLAILQPLLQVDFGLPNFLPAPEETAATADILAASAEFADQLHREAQGTYQADLCAQLEALALLAPGVTAATAQGRETGCLLQVWGSQDVSQKIYGLAEAFCGLDQEGLTLEMNVTSLVPAATAQHESQGGSIY